MNNLTHIDLFTGIGGFTLACHWLSIKTEVMCEIDPRCREFLRRTWPDTPIIENIKDFKAKDWQGQFLLTGGVPCQPASRAGKQRGKRDDRWLWPEAIRVVSEAHPRWCLFENPSGIYDVGLEGILDELESCGYEVGTVEIPACAVNAPHIRQRVWILANSISSGSNKQAISIRRQKKGEISLSTWASQGNMANGKSEHHEWTKPTRSGQWQPKKTIRNTSGLWNELVWLPCADGKVRRAPDDSFGVAYGLHRSILAALGNSIVPQVAYEIIKAIIKTENEK